MRCRALGESCGLNRKNRKSKAESHAASKDHLPRHARDRRARRPGLLHHNIKLEPAYVDRWPGEIRLSDLEPRFICKDLWQAWRHSEGRERFRHSERPREKEAAN